MKTKFDIDQTVWFLDITRNEIVGEKVQRIIIEPEGGEVYQLGGDDGYIWPVSCLFSAKEVCRAHYLQMLK